MGRGLCLFEDKKKDRYILAPSVLGPNLPLPAHKFISPNSFYEMLNKGNTVPLIIINIFLLHWQTISVNFNESVRKYMLNFGVRVC